MASLLSLFRKHGSVKVRAPGCRPFTILELDEERNEMLVRYENGEGGRVLAECSTTNDYEVVPE